MKIINIDWLNARMDYETKKSFIKKFMKCYNIEPYHYEDIQDLYSKLLYDIYTDQMHFDLAPSDRTLFRNLYWIFQNFCKKNDRHLKKLIAKREEENNDEHKHD